MRLVSVQDEPVIGNAGLAASAASSVPPSSSSSGRSRTVVALILLILVICGTLAGREAAGGEQAPSQGEASTRPSIQPEKDHAGPRARSQVAATDQEKPDARRSVRLPLGPVRFDGAPMREAIARWGKETGLSVVIDWDAMDAEGVGPDTPVSLVVDRVCA